MAWGAAAGAPKSPPAGAARYEVDESEIKNNKIGHHMIVEVMVREAAFIESSISIIDERTIQRFYALLLTGSGRGAEQSPARGGGSRGTE